MSKMEVFDIDSFLKRYSKLIEKIETKQISDWLNCSIRYVQKYAERNDVPFHRVQGRKYYIWNEDSIFDFMIWHNSKYEKKTIKIIKRMKIDKKVIIQKVKKEKIIPFKTISDFVNENEDRKKRSKKTITKNIRKWANENNVPFKYLYGRKYFIMTEELFELYKLSENENDRNNDNLKHNYSMIDSEIKDNDYYLLKQIANEQK
jgi:hypothetical protein